MVIYEGIKALASSLNESFRSSQRWSGDRVVLSGLAEPDGNPPLLIENKLVLTLLTLDNESTLKNLTAKPRRIDGMLGQGAHSYHFNANLLMSAACTNYDEGLKLLSDGISFMLAKGSLTHQNTPSLPDSITKLTTETVQVSIEHLSHIWGAIGSKLLPAVLFKMRMITVSGKPQTYVPEIKGSDLDKSTTG